MVSQLIFRTIHKASEAELRLERLLRSYEATVQREFREFIRVVRSDTVISAIADALAKNDLAGAMAIMESHIARLGAVMTAVFATAGRDYAALLLTEFQKYQPAIALSFDPSFPRAAELSRSNRLRFVRDFTASQREALRIALVRGFTEGWNANRIAREVRSVIGLTDRQERAVQNYRRLLEQGSTEALTRDLRDRRFDGAVRRAARTNQPLTREQIDRMVERYRDRSLAYRSEVISRTEAGRAASLAQEEALEQSLEMTGMDRNRVRRVWRTVGDSRVRDTHVAMNGQVKGLNEPFVSPSGARLRYPRDPSAPGFEVVNCRCVLETRFLPPEV